MGNFIFPIEPARIVTISMAAFSLVFGSAYAAEEITITRRPEMTVRCIPPAVVADKMAARYSRFRGLASQWQADRNAASFIDEICNHPAYMGIIGMGKEALPFIFAQLDAEGNEPDHWFSALQSITGANPVPEEDYGDIAAMSRAWREWADLNDAR